MLIQIIYLSWYHFVPCYMPFQGLHGLWGETRFIREFLAEVWSTAFVSRGQISLLRSFIVSKMSWKKYEDPRHSWSLVKKLCLHCSSPQILTTIPSPYDEVKKLFLAPSAKLNSPDINMFNMSLTFGYENKSWNKNRRAISNWIPTKNLWIFPCLSPIAIMQHFA